MATKYNTPSSSLTPQSVNDNLIGHEKRRLRSEWFAANPLPLGKDDQPIKLSKEKQEERWEQVLEHLNSFEYICEADGTCTVKKKGK